jgi:PKD-like domain
MRTFISCLLISASLCGTAQQISLDWATETVPSNNRVKFASNGDVFALGSGTNSAVIQRLAADGALLWTKTLQAPTLYAIDMDVDGSDNIYISAGFTSGQLDLDPGPNTALVNPGKVYGKYTSNGQFLWGFSIENSTDLSEDYSGISCDDAGNLYVCGDLGQGTYDFDPGPGTYNLTCGDFTIGSYIARYRPNGSLVFADVRTWYGGFSSSRDIAAMRDGSSFYVVQTLDNGGPLSSQIDVDPGPGNFYVYTETQSILRYDSVFTFMAQGYTNFGDQRLCVDAAGAAYLMARAQAGSGFWAVKYNQQDQVLNQVYSTSLYTYGNLRMGDISPDEQGGCVGMYSNNCDFNKIRFYKMNVSGLVDFNLYLDSGTDCTYPGGKGFDLRGGSFAMGTYNSGYTVDFDPGANTLSPPTVGNSGVVARYDWCSSVPYDPINIVQTTPLCANTEASFEVEAFGDASLYTWTVPLGWTLLSAQGGATITVSAGGAGLGQLEVVAVNACGASAPVTGQFEVVDAQVDAGPDQVICTGHSTVLSAISPAADTYQWSPFGGNTATTEVTPNFSTMFTITISNADCLASDQVTVVVDPCLGLNEVSEAVVGLSPVPAMVGELVRVEGLRVSEIVGIRAADGRNVEAPVLANGEGALVNTTDMPAGAYTLLAIGGRAWRFVVMR